MEIINLQQEIEEFLTCLAPLSTQKCENQNMVEEYMKVDGQEILGKTNYIEEWFHFSIRPTIDSLLQQFLVPHQNDQVVLHVQVYVKVYILNLTINLFVILLRTWILWKSIYA